MNVRGEDASPAKMKEDRKQQQQKAEGQGGSLPLLVIYASSACLVVALTLLIVELFVMLAVASRPLLSSINEIELMLRNVNFVLAPMSGSGGEAPASPDDPPTFDEASGEAFFAWCEAAPCLAGRNCTQLVLGLRDGVDPQTGAPAIPFADTFCDSLSVMNEQLCFCADSLSDGSFPEDGQAILDNMGFIAMFCPGFGQENVADRGQCAA